MCPIKKPRRGGVGSRDLSEEGVPPKKEEGAWNLSLLFKRKEVFNGNDYMAKTTYPQTSQ